MSLKINMCWGLARKRSLARWQQGPVIAAVRYRSICAIFINHFCFLVLLNVQRLNQSVFWLYKHTLRSGLTLGKGVLRAASALRGGLQVQVVMLAAMSSK